MTLVQDGTEVTLGVRILTVALAMEDQPQGRVGNVDFPGNSGREHRWMPSSSSRRKYEI